MKLMWLDFLTYVELLSCVSIVNHRVGGGGGGLATASDLAAFRLSMIAPVKKSVNHLRTVASIGETGWKQQQQVRLRSDSTVRSEFRITINEVPYELFTLHASWCPKGPLKKFIETFSWCLDAGKPKNLKLIALPSLHSPPYLFWRKICTQSHSTKSCKLGSRPRCQPPMVNSVYSVTLDTILTTNLKSKTL